MAATTDDDFPAPLPKWVAAACTRCGKCCLEEKYMLSLCATDVDVKRWKREGRKDILQYVYTSGPGLHDLWVNQEGEALSRCPFVRKDRGKPTYHCTIYETRPEACREYPVDVERMVDIGCEIINEVENLASTMEAEKMKVAIRAATSNKPKD